MASHTPLPVEARSPATVGERERDEVIRRLGDHFALDHLSLQDYEFRVNAALQARQWYELNAATNDLPDLGREKARPIVGRERRRTSGTLLAIMGGVVRKGRWLLPTRLRAWAMMGGVDIDLRDADFSDHVTDIFAVAIMGGVSIRVPPGVRLECDGIAIMGAFEDQSGLAAVSNDASPVVRVRGLALMGGVVTEVKRRGEDDEQDD